MLFWFVCFLPFISVMPECSTMHTDTDTAHRAFCWLGRDWETFSLLTVSWGMRCPEVLPGSRRSPQLFVCKLKRDGIEPVLGREWAAPSYRGSRLYLVCCHKPVVFHGMLIHKPRGQLQEDNFCPG